MDNLQPTIKRHGSPIRKIRNITPIRQIDTPNPQAPYTTNTPNLYQTRIRPISANGSPPKGSNRIKPMGKKLTKNDKTSSNSVLNVRSSRLFQMLNEKTHRFEGILEGFLHTAADTPLYLATESILKQQLNAAEVIFWQDIPSLQLLYSPKKNKVIGHTRGIIGQTFFSRQKITVEDAVNNPFYVADIDGDSPSMAMPQMYFPIWDFSNTVCAVVQVFKKDGFSEDDDEFVTYFVKKFKVYSHWLDQPKTPHSLLLELMQIMELEQFLLLFQKKITNLFQCEIAEIWKMNKKTSEMWQYRRTPKEIKDCNAGIVGEAFRKGILINCEDSKMQSSYHMPVDGEKNMTVLVFPMFDTANGICYALALREKTSSPIFTLQDEMLIRTITPYIILSFNNIEKFTIRSKDDRFNQSEHHCVTDLQQIVSMLDNNEEPKSVVNSAMEKLEYLASADRSSLFLYDKEDSKLTTLYYSGLKGPISIKSDRGLVGVTFRESQVVNIPDAYEDPLFDSTTDLETSYRTRSLLSVPIRTDHFKTIGVIQLLNRNDGKPFSKQDVEYAKIFSHLCGLVLKSSKRYEKLKRRSNQVKSLIKVGEVMRESHDSIRNKINDTLKTAKEIMECENYSLFIVDHVLGILTTYIVDGPKLPPTFPLSNGIAASTVTLKEHPILIVNDAYHDPRFNSTADMNNGFKTHSILAVPVFSQKGEVIAVCEMINKRDGLPFTNDDANLMKTFCLFIGQTIEMQKMSNVLKYGVAELEMQKWIGELERKSYSIPKKLQIPPNKKDEVTTLNFFCIEWNGIGLFKIAFFVFNQFNLLEKYQIPNDLFFIFLVKLRSMYNDAPYHNWIHAIDVLQYVCYQIKKSNFETILNSDELLSLCVGAICHDAGHEGLNNAYLQKAETPLGILYKDQSVCEMHHCAVAISVMSKDESNIFHAIPKEDLKKIWKLIIQLILATDMVHHFKLLKKANDIMDQGPINLSNPSHRLMTLQMTIKIADISNVSRPFDIADKWCDVLCEEFWRQGDMERENGWEISSPLNDRSVREKAKGQVNFYQFVCLPLYTAIARILPELQCNAEAVNNNLQVWKEKVEQLEQLKKAEEAQK